MTRELEGAQKQIERANGRARAHTHTHEIERENENERTGERGHKKMREGEREKGRATNAEAPGGWRQW